MNPASRRLATISMLAGAVAFGMVLAGALDLGPAGMAAPAPQSAALAPAAAGAPFSSFADLAERALPAVVSIDAQTIERGHPPVRRRQQQAPGQQDPFEFFFGPRGREQSPDAEREFRSDAGGSGFVVSTDGFVVTNNHVIEGATKVRVRLEGRDYDAEVKGVDPATDLALLKIDAGRPLVALPLGDSQALRVGEQVMAIGNPLALGSTVTVGVVSAKGRSIGLTRDTSFENFIQTDAAINRGNSGGPLVNLRGEVIGIATAMNWGAENIGFAVPVDTLKAVLPQLRDRGRVSRGYLGINIQNMTWERAQAFGLAESEGALVTAVVEGQPAAKAGLKHGDVVLNVDGRKVRETRDLIDYVSSKPPGSHVMLDVLRDGKRMKLDVELSEREALAAETSEGDDEAASGIEWLGIDYQDLAPGLRQNLGVPAGVDGVVVREVAGSSPLYDEGVASGDVVTEVNGRPVADSAAFEREVGAAAPGSFLRLYVRRFDPRGRGDGVGFFAIVRVP
ncbi:MAG: Do family serine endopeptidase [Thermoanaerobaculia bacterium]|nr:Do family serine endopeptidase [Thermoanaerobaculia bacterium]